MFGPQPYETQEGVYWMICRTMSMMIAHELDHLSHHACFAFSTFRVNISQLKKQTKNPENILTV